MINIKSRAQKIRYRNLTIRRMAYLELINARKLRPAVSGGFKAAIDLVRAGVTDEEAISQAIDMTADRGKELLLQAYKRTDRVFLPLADTAVETTKKKLDHSGDFGHVVKDSIITSLFRQLRLSTLTKIAGDKIVDVTNTTKKIVKNILIDGIEDGLTPQEIAVVIESHQQQFSPGRALRIARTETHSAAVSAQQDVIKESGFDTEKEWVSSGDDYVRSVSRGSKFDHAKANGERVPIDDPFVRTGEGILYPGDPNGSAGNVINCRCVELYHTV